MTERKIAKANRGVKGIWIPSHYWLDENLTIQEMLFLAEIDSLDIDEKGCFATNKHFADFFGLTPSRCSQVITSLKEKGYIEVELVFNKKKDIKNRTIRVVNKLNTPIKNIKGGYLENCASSNTSFSNTKDNMSSSEKIPYSEIISFLNQVTNKKYKVTQKWKELIKARWNEGQRLDDFKKVINVKSSQWLNDSNMNKYLRPQTLFGNKFDDYLQEYKEPTKSSPMRNDFEGLEDLFGDPA